MSQTRRHLSRTHTHKLIAGFGFSLLVFVGQTQGRADGIATDSPFAPPASQSGQAKEDTSYQLAGITTLGTATHVCIADSGTKKSRWISVGSSADNITVLSCDVLNNSAVVRVGSETKTLFLRKATTQKAAFVTPVPQSLAAQAPAPNGAPAAPLPEKIDPSMIRQPETREEKEREARMLVSDLLDIGMRQRKAYEEARKAEEAKRKGQPAAPAVQVAPATQK